MAGTKADCDHNVLTVLFFVLLQFSTQFNDKNGKIIYVFEFLLLFYVIYIIIFVWIPRYVWNGTKRNYENMSQTGTTFGF